MNKIIPGQKMPDFQVDLPDGTKWRLYDHAPKTMLLLDFYRGFHCPRCRNRIETINDSLDDFEKAGLDVIAISADSDERSAMTQAEWKCDRITLGHNLSLEDASKLGLYLSSTIDIRPLEQKIFCEPSVMVVRSDLTLYGAIIQTFPFARPSIEELISIPEFAITNGYPPRGDYVLPNEKAAAE